MNSLLTVFALLLAACFPPPLHAKTIQIVGDNWCPYNCAADAPLQGYLVDLLRSALEPEYKISYSLEPWTRAVELVGSGQRDILLATTPSTTPEFRLSEPVGIDRTCFFTRIENPWRYRRPDDLARLRLGVVQDYNYDANGPLDKLIADYRKRRDNRLETAFGADAIQTNFRKLVGGRMDVVAENESVATFTLRTLKLNAELRSAGCATHYLGTVHLGFARSWGPGQAIAKRIDERIATMRQSGELTTVLARYGLRDWWSDLPQVSAREKKAGSAQ